MFHACDTSNRLMFISDVIDRRCLPRCGSSNLRQILSKGEKSSETPSERVEGDAGHVTVGPLFLGQDPDGAHVQEHFHGVARVAGAQEGLRGVSAHVLVQYVTAAGVL